jgi:3-oxoacyl-[acyl-carrier protein] reductase
MPLQIDLSGHIALVTGAAGDLGRVIARTLARCGADVAVHYHTNQKMAEQVLADVRAAGAVGMIVQADVTDAASVAAMHDAVVAGLGDVDILVPNAVSQVTWKTPLEQTVEMFEDQFRSCVLQTVLLAKAFAPAMIAKRYGRVVIINTECSMQCIPSQAAYAVAKRGLDGLARMLAKDLGPHQITVNQIAPGWMISDRDRAAHSEDQPGYQKTVPLGHRGEDTEIAHAVAFLASDLAKFISGVYLPVAGGNVMPCI